MKIEHARRNADDRPMNDIERVIHNQEVLEKKLDEVLSLMSRAPDFMDHTSKPEEIR